MNVRYDQTTEDLTRGSGSDCYTLRPLSRFRDVVVDVAYKGQKVPEVHGFLQCNLTGIRRRLGQIRQSGEIPPSMIVYCVPQAVAQNLGVHAIRKTPKLLTFSGADPSTALELRVDHNRTVPPSLVLRSANRMSLQEIQGAITAAHSARFAAQLSKRLVSGAELETCPGPLPRYGPSGRVSARARWTHADELRVIRKRGVNLA